MYKMNPPKVYVHERVHKDLRCVKRMERMMEHIETPSVEHITDADVPRVLEEVGIPEREVRLGNFESTQDSPIIFTSFNWDFNPGRLGLTMSWRDRAMRAMYGDERVMWHASDPIGAYMSNGCICNGYRTFHVIWGCPHLCRYCGIGGQATYVMLNIEEWLERLHRYLERWWWHKIFHFDPYTDIHAWEPEYGVSKMLVEYFAKTSDRYILFFSKSANIDHLLDLDHKGHTLFQWSISGHTGSRVAERKTATDEERIEAARRCSEAGYTVRWKVKPIIPVTNWREEYTDMIERTFANFTPQHINMAMLAMMPIEELKRIFPMWEKLFDADCIRAAEGAREELRNEPGGSFHGPFPHKTRAEIYAHIMDEIARVSPETTFSICSETERMWEALAPRMGMTSAKFICSCGGQCVPAHPMYKRKD